MLIRAGHMLTWPAERYPDKIALTYQGQHWTFREVDTRVNRLANGLLELGLSRGDRVAALLYNSPRALEVRFALMKAGLCMVALNVRQAAPEHAFIINHSESRALLLDQEYVETWEDMRAQCPGVQQVIVAGTDTSAYLSYAGLIAASSPVEPEIMVSLDDLERLAYTSGTTGRPKGIMKTVGNDLAQLRNDFLNEDVPTSAADIMLNVAPLTHAARGPLRKHYVKGARNIILRDFHEETVFATIQQERVTTAMFVPTMLIRLTLHPQARDYDLSSLQRISFGTAPMPVDKLQEAMALFGNVFRPNYGMSEATQPVLCMSPQELEGLEPGKRVQRLGSAGRPALGVEVRLADDDGAPVAPGSEGELLIRGEIVMPGYWQDPETSRETLDEAGWLHTGDIARQDEEGYVYIVGRKKDMIISGGFNIYPREVELVIESHPGVQEVAVIGVPDPIWGESVKAVVLPRAGASLTADEIITLCTQHLASYKKPRSVDIVEDLPRNFQGKILKRELREHYWQGQERRV